MLIPWVRGPLVLDAGCGMGFMTRALAAQGHRVVAIDVERDYVAAATRSPAGAGPIADGLVARDGGFPFASASYDTVISLDVIEHIADDRPVLRELARLLRPDGRLVLTVPALPALFGQRDVSLGHYRRYTRPMLRERLSEAGFVVEALAYWNLLGVGPYFVAERVLRRQLPDTIRQGPPTRARQIVARLAMGWLLAEWRVAPAIPLGLSLVARARPAGPRG